MNESRIYEIAIGLIPGVGNMLTKQLISYCGSPEAVFKTRKGKLLKIPQVGENLASAIINSDLLKKAESEIKKAEKANVKLLFYTDQDYPGRLKMLPDAPVLIYYKGNVPLNPEKSVAIVGTRNATAYGREMVGKIVQSLKAYAPTIISGLATGIDITAHKASLQHHLPTIGVMASGIDIIYPAMHKETAAKMQQNGGILTEYPFGEKPNAYNFPSRNRIIAGLADAVIVAEAAETGGALITARLANDYHREVLALPGNINQKYSKGCNQLIHNHEAIILNETDKLIKVLNWDQQYTKQNTPDKQKHTQPQEPPEGLTDEEQVLFKALNHEKGCHIDTLSQNTQIPVNRLASVLLSLEFKGLVKALPGKLYKLAG